MDIHENTGAAFKSTQSAREKEKYFRVETMKSYTNSSNSINNHNTSIPSTVHTFNKTNKNKQNHNFKTTVMNSPNISNEQINNHVSFTNTTNIKTETSPNNSPESKSVDIFREQDLCAKVNESTCKLIHQNRLYFNDFWKSKITQEDLCLPKSLPQGYNKDLQMILLNSTNALCKKINELFTILCDNTKNKKLNDSFYQDLLILFEVWGKKITIICELKPSVLHIYNENSDSFPEIFQVRQHLWYMKRLLKKEFGSQLRHILTIINEFCENWRGNEMQER